MADGCAWIELLLVWNLHGWAAVGPALGRHSLPVLGPPTCPHKASTPRLQTCVVKFDASGLTICWEHESKCFQSSALLKSEV